MNRVAAYAVVLLCASSLACKTGGTPPPAPPPPPPPPTQMTCEIPPTCQAPSGKILVGKLATLPAGQDCIVVSRSAIVEWEGDIDVKTLLIGWNQKPAPYLCETPPPAAPCAGKSCKFDTATLPPMKAPLCLCYGVGVVDNGGIFSSQDPRLIIRP